tara:strand:+ start:226 stop:408 length:183 start_codon:yes stop_codon:yes gene_type:complete
MITAARPSNRSGIDVAASIVGDPEDCARAMLAPEIRNGLVPATLENRTRIRFPSTDGRTI